MTRQILSCPLQHLETIGASKLLATLTGDINAIAGASIQLSLIIVNLAILIGIFAYLCWLSPLLFLMVFASIVGGFALFNFIQQLGLKILSAIVKCKMFYLSIFARLPKEQKS